MQPKTAEQLEEEELEEEETAPARKLSAHHRFQPNTESFVTDSEGEVVVEAEEEEVEDGGKIRVMDQLREEGPSPAEQFKQMQEQLQEEEAQEQQEAKQER